MPAQDGDLLARLHALKPSTVSFDTAPKASVKIEVSRPQTVNRLADRLKALRFGGSPAADGESGPLRANRADALTAQVKDEVAPEPDPIREWQQNDGDDEQTLDELLAAIGPDGRWRLDPEDPKHVASLLEEAKAALPDHMGSAEDDGESRDDSQHTSQKDVQDEALDQTDAPKTEDHLDEEEADEYVQKVLAELDFERKYGGDEEGKETVQETEDPSAAGADHLDLPSTPSSLPHPPPGTEPSPPTYEDSELEARFSKLGLDLPSTPSAPPSAQPKITASIPRGSKKSKLPTYTDEDIETWCCICSEDGEVRCVGCDGDIYCQSCWREGHGNGPGQERGHRAVQFVRKGGGSLAPA